MYTSFFVDNNDMIAFRCIINPLCWWSVILNFVGTILSSAVRGIFNGPGPSHTGPQCSFYSEGLDTQSPTHRLRGGAEAVCLNTIRTPIFSILSAVSSALGHVTSLRTAVISPELFAF